jgi:hypothetical protein
MLHDLKRPNVSTRFLLRDADRSGIPLEDVYMLDR